MRYTLPKIAKLKSRKQIEYLFSEGTSVKKYPLLMICAPLPPEEVPVLKVGFSVSKRNFKKAVHRNRIKRLMREAYRLNQHTVKTAEGQKFACMFLYLGKEELSFGEINASFIKLIEKFNQQH